MGLKLFSLNFKEKITIISNLRIKDLIKFIKYTFR